MKSKTTWDLSPLFGSDKDPEIKRQRDTDTQKTKAFIEKWKDRTDYLTDPTILKEALDEYELWRRGGGTYDREFFYFDLRNNLEMSNPKLKALLNQVEDLGTKLQNEIQFFCLRIAQIETKNQAVFLNDPNLKEYKHFLELLFKEAKYHLSEEVEKVINLKWQTSHNNWTRMVSSFIAEEEREVLLEDGSKKMTSFAGLNPLLSSHQKLVRDGAAIAVNDILKKHAGSAEQEMNSILANKKVDDELRNLPRPDTARHIADDIETEVVDVLMESVSRKFDISRKWYELKAKLLGLTPLEYHERLMEYGQVDIKYSYEDSCQLVSKVFEKLDPEFKTIFDGFVGNGQIDAHPKKGKHGGGFCADMSLSLPSYILVNHTDKLNDVSTLAHEAGHGINNELMKKKVNALNFGTPLSTAEVASTFMEDFVIAEVLREINDEMKLALMIKKMDNEVATIFRQTACYLFEQDLHRQFRQKGYLSKEEIGKLFQKHMAAYMGPAVIQSEGSENWWVHWGHVRSFFYVYSYVSGLLISKSLQGSVKNDPNFILKVKEFLAAGTSESPRDTFAKLGVDITQESFWKEGLREVEDLLQEIEELARRLVKIK